MSYGAVIKILGYLLLVEAALMVPSLLVALYYGQSDRLAFVISILITGIVGFFMSRKSLILSLKC